MKKLSMILALIMTTGIFLMSVMSGNESGGLSLQITDNLLNFIDKIIPANNINLESLDHVVRKTAHIAEYSILGVLWFITAKEWKLSILKILAIGLVTASIDEIIQLFSENRGSSIVDVLLFDFLPFLIITSLITLIYNNRTGGKEKVISDTLADLADNKISTKKAYKKIYKTENRTKIPFTRRAHFVKLRIIVPGEKGVNTFLRILFFMPLPIFLVTFGLRFVKLDKTDSIPLSKSEIINLVSSKGINIKVNSHSGEKVYIKTI